MIIVKISNSCLCLVGLVVLVVLSFVFGVLLLLVGFLVLLGGVVIIVFC